MSPDPTRPDVFLEQDSTRVVNTLDLATQTNQGRARIRVEPTTATVTALTGGNQSGGAVTVRNERGDTVSRLDTGAGAGRVELRDKNVVEGITLRTNNGEGELRLHDETAPVVELASDQERGRVKINRSDGENRVLAAVSSFQNERGAGLLELKNDDGFTTFRLRGRDGALELQNPPEVEGDDDPINFEGGDLVLQDWWDEGERDVYVHATGNENSAYGTEQGNRPRIFLDGRRARVELGREELGGNREAVAGRIKLRFGFGTGDNTTLEAWAGTPSSADQGRVGEITLRKNEQGTLHHKGSLGSSSEGVDLTAGGGATAVLVDTTGTVRTRQSVDEEALPKVGPRFYGYQIVVPQGDTATFDITLADDTTTDVQFGDEQTTGYELRGTLEADPDVNATLQFDTSAAGTSSTTVTVEGDVVWNQQYETQLNGALPTGDYDFRLEGASSGRSVTGLLTID